MSTQSPIKRITWPQIRSRKGRPPIVSLTSYHAHTAAIADPYADFISVGDSSGTVMHAMESTLGVPLLRMIMHAKPVVTRPKRALIPVAIPFGTYVESPELALPNAARIMKETGYAAVKPEVGQRMSQTIKLLVERGLPVMAHMGLTPQSSPTMGGFSRQGQVEDNWPGHELDAQSVSVARAFPFVIEGMVEPRGSKITRQLPIPTIGIVASVDCAGGILVLEDMLCLNPGVAPKFVKLYGDLVTQLH